MCVSTHALSPRPPRPSPASFLHIAWPRWPFFARPSASPDLPVHQPLNDASPPPSVPSPPAKLQSPVLCSRHSLPTAAAPLLPAKRPRGAAAPSVSLDPLIPAPAPSAEYGAVDRPAPLPIPAVAGSPGGRAPPKPPSAGGGGGDSGGRGDEGDGGGRLPGTPWAFIAALLRHYLTLLERAPLATKMSTAAVLGAVSDLLAQAIERMQVSRAAAAAASSSSRGSASHGVPAVSVSSPSVSLRAVEWRRVASLAAVGALLTAPMFHFLYEALERVLPCSGGAAAAAAAASASAEGRRARAVRNTVAQLAVDQLVAAPVWMLAFYASFSVLENGTLRTKDVAAQIRRDFVPTLKLTWAVFPVFQIMSFALLPIKMRVLVLNVLDIGYTAALSWLQHS